MKAAGLVTGRIEHVDAPHDRPARVIDITIQDPGTPDAFMRAVQAIAPPGNGPILESDIQILAVEIALDAYPRTPADRAGLVDVTLHLFRQIAHPPAGMPRITCPGKRYQAAALQRDVRRALELGYSINLGEIGTNFTMRAYFKNYDSKADESYAGLLPEEYRARLEVTLSGDRLPFTTIAEWRDFRFETLGGYFAMTRATPGSPMVAMLLGQLAQLGNPLDTIKQTQHRRTNKRSTRRDTVLNQRIADALRALTKRTAAPANEAENAGIHEKSFPSDQPHQWETATEGGEVLNTLILNPRTGAPQRAYAATRPHRDITAHPAHRHCPTWVADHNTARHHLGRQRTPTWATCHGPPGQTLYPLSRIPKASSPRRSFFLKFQEPYAQKEQNYGRTKGPGNPQP
jgi:hypothetical protein